MHHTKKTTVKQNHPVITCMVAVSLLGLVGCQHMHTQHTANQTTYHNSSNKPKSFALANPTKQPNLKNPLCKDYLSDMGIKPIELTFVGCRAGFYTQSHALIASYSLKGSNAFSVQEQLHNLSGMPRLTKDCCNWESLNTRTGKNIGEINHGNKTYYIHMQSNELRLGWGIASDIERIPYFTVSVIHPLAEKTM